MKASVITLGCKVNEYESQSIMNQLKTEGYEIFEGLVPADVYVINTCAVTNMGERKSRQVLSKIEKLNPEARIVVVGCAVQNNPAQFLKNTNVIALTGNYGKHDIINFINNQNKNLPELEHNRYINMARPIETRTRQYIKIQDGCNYFCTYCIIPYVRGRSRSRDINDIISEIKATNANEIVLTGINMSDYRINGELALKTVVEEVDKLNVRFRISSIECNVLTKDMLQTLKTCKNFCPHFHLSLQSACNETLKRMNRRYTIEQFKQVVKDIRELFPKAFVATDIIVGFKGETDEEFEITYNNLKEIGFNFMHIFPYSERAGTVATKLGGTVEKNIVKCREHKLIALNNKNIKQTYESNLGSKHSVLVEVVENNNSYGYTENYIYTRIKGKYKVGDIIQVKLVEIAQNEMIGEEI